MFTHPSQTVKRWFPVEHYEGEPINLNASLELLDGSFTSNARWRIIGEVLLSIRIDGNQFEVGMSSEAEGEGTVAEKSKRKVAAGKSSVEELFSPRKDSSALEDVCISAGASKIVYDEPWGKTSAVLLIDVYDEDGFSGLKREFMGRARLPLHELITDDQVLEQDILHSRWVPLSLRFDGSRSDHALWEISQGRKYIGSSLIGPSGTKRGQAVSKIIGVPSRILLKRKPTKGSAEDEDLSSSALNQDISSVLEDKEDNPDMRIEWMQPEYPFGEILIRAQVILPDPNNEEAYRRKKVAKEAEKLHNYRDKYNE
jgi:hypothetical protein